MKKYVIAVALLLATANCFAQLKQYNITAYGAVANSKIACTKALQAAIDACNANGGGDVVVPTGVFLMGTVHLKSNVHLYLQDRSTATAIIILNLIRLKHSIMPQPNTAGRVQISVM